MTGKVCVKCQVEMRPELNGVGALSMAGAQPYELYDADLWKCPTCGVEMILGFGKRPIAMHFETDFAASVARYEKLIRFWSTPKDRKRGQSA